MAHTKAKGSTNNGRDSRGQRLGVKRFGGQLVGAGEILIRQRGSKWYGGEGVKQVGDDSLIATRAGQVYFTRAKVGGFRPGFRTKTFINVRELP